MHMLPSAQPPDPDRLEPMAALAGAIAHEFNNFVTGILGHLRLAQLLGQQGQPNQDSLVQIERITHRLAGRCQQLATIAGKPAELGIAEDPATVMRNSLETLSDDLPGLPRLHIEFPDRIPALPIAESLLSEVLAILVRNGAEATSSLRGELWIRSGIGIPGIPVGMGHCTFSFGIPADPHRFFLEVQDNGPGLAEAILARFGEPYLTPRETKRGFGLAQLVGIVRAHQGGLRVHSRQGQGTLIQIFLPTRIGLPAEDTLPRTPAREPLEATFGGPPGILVVDDEESVREVSTELLLSLGCRVAAVRTGEEALERFLADEGRFDLALVDLTLPGLSGEDTIRQLRQAAPRLVVVGMSGHPESEFAATPGFPPLAGYLKKPFRLPDLANLLQENDLLWDEGNE